MDTTVPTRRASLRDVSPGRLHGVGARVVLDELMRADVPDAPVKLRHPAPVKLRPKALALASLDRLVATVAVYDHVADEIESALSELAALAPYAAKVEVS